MMMSTQIRNIIALALCEDVGNGDITTQAVFKKQMDVQAQFLTKSECVIAGLEIVLEVFTSLSDKVTFTPLVNDGDVVQKGTIVASVSGSSDILLTGERTALNFLQRMSGIATATRAYVDLVSHTKAKILDTRKTVPGHRELDKWAVRLGGGENHRFRLDDRYLIKENHIRVAGSIQKAIEMVAEHRKNLKVDAEIEIEVTGLAEFEEVLSMPGNIVRFVMLDNMSNDEMKTAVTMNNGRYLLEASGNVNIGTVKTIAETGVDYISVGNLTHSVKAADISLLFNTED